MPHFEFSSLIHAPVEEVWHFHERSDILQILTPPWQPVQVVRRQGGLGVGAISEFRIFLGPIPVKWVAVHTECDPYRIFTDEQQQGPMETWIHRHQFAADQGQTRLTDAISYSVPGGWLVNFLLTGWISARLDAMFRYRHEITRRYCDLGV